MKKNNENTNPDNPMMGNNFFGNGIFHWKKTEEEVWAEIEEKLKNFPEKKLRNFYFGPKIISIAASIAVIVGIVSFLRFYSTTTKTLSGVHQTAYLPDGSTVQMNAESELTYYPYWWKFERIMKFEGEGFFKVQKGNKFVVHAQLVDVEVLGTSFNVFARPEATRVCCATGRVRVTSDKEQVVILPNSKVELQRNNELRVTNNISLDYDLAWRNNYFRFESEPLKNVFLEIERQYGVKIEMEFHSMAIYSGNFHKKENVENILNYVCSAMGLTFRKKSDNEYIILQKK